MKHKKALFALAQILITLFNIETSFATNSKEISTNNWVRYEDYKVKINAPEKWRIERDLYGMSIMVLGPERGEERAVLSVQETPLHNFQFDFKLIEKTKDEYYVGRKKFIGEFDDAYYLKDLPYKRLIGKNGNSGFEMGFQYRARDLTIEEKSIQLVCGERLFLLKSLTNENTPTEDLKALENIVNQFECSVATLNDGEYSPSPLYNFAEKFEKAARAGFPWPTKNDFKQASLDSKVATVSSLVNFYKEYEEAGGNDLYSRKKMEDEKSYALYQDKSDKLADIFMQNAFADEDYDCFFAGWPSKFKRIGNKSTCANPKNTNSNYEKVASQCGENKLTCNPSLFGSDICVDLSNPEERSQATLKCEVEMRSKNRSFEEVVKDPTYDEKNLSETLTSAKTICTQEPYISTNTGLCSTLKEKLTESIGAGAVPQEDQDQNFISGVDEKLNPETFDQNVSQVTGNYVDFEKRCIDEKGDLKEEVQGCAEELNQILSDLEKIDRHEAQINEELNGQENQSEQLNNQNCENCGPDQSNVQNISKKQEVKKQKTYACTPEQYKRKKERECGWNWKMLTAGPSCSLNMLTAILKSLWGSVKAIVGLIWDGVKYVGNKLVQGAKWVAGLFGYEDESSKKVAAASRTSNKAIDEFKKDPFSAAVTFFKEIYNSLADYVANDVACEDWSGIPHMSKCLRPATSWECQPCLDRIDTVCSAIGVVAAEVIPAVFTGGASAALKGAGLGAKVAGIVGKMGKLGKLTRLESKLAKTLKISKVAGKTEDVTKITARISKLKTGASITGDLTKSQKILGKIYNVSRWPTAKYKKIKFAYYRAKTALKAFKSTKFGGIKSTIDRLRNIRNQYYVLRAGSWVVKNSVKAVYNTTVKLPVKIALSPITVPLKTSKGFIKLQTSANKVGFKVSDAIIDQSYKTTSWLSKKAFNKTLVRSSVGQVYNPMLRDFASKVVTYGTVAKVPYRMKIAVDKTAEKAIFKFKTDEELSIEAKNYNMNTKDYKSYIRILYSGDEPTEADRKTISSIALKQGYPVEMLIGQSVEVRLLEAATCNEVHFSEYDYQNYAIYSGIETKEAKKQIQADLYQSKKDCGN